MKGLCNIADRVLKYECGITQEETEKDHDENLRNFLLRMEQVEVELNPARWKFKTPKVIFTGFQLNFKGSAQP